MEKRRGARVDACFLIAIDGIDAEPMLRYGDISDSGVYFETRRDVGDVGTLHWIHLVSIDRVKRIRVLASVVRTTALGESDGAHATGVALDFVPDSDSSRAAVHDFVHHVLKLRFDRDEAPCSDRFDVSLDNRPATVRSLSVRSIVLETTWPIRPGDGVQVDIVGPGMTSKIRVDGRAVRVAPSDVDASTYEVELEVHTEKKRPLNVDTATRLPPVPRLDPPPRRREALSGKLAQVHLPTLLALIETERTTGKLVLRRGAEESRVYVVDGRIVDVEPLAASAELRARIAALVAWEDGVFELHSEPVTRPDRVQLTTTALLLDALREADEARR